MPSLNPSLQGLKKERIKKRIYKNRELAQADVSDYIHSFYNPTRRHFHLGGVSPLGLRDRCKARVATCLRNPGYSRLQWGAWI
jgi:hypothetical protein